MAISFSYRYSDRVGQSLKVFLKQYVSSLSMLGIYLDADTPQVPMYPSSK
jgi:hypothetical protein